MIKRAQLNMSLKNSILFDPQINIQMISDFWEHYVPFVRMSSSEHWEHMPRKASAFETKFSQTEQHLFDRMLARYVYILSDRFESDFYLHISERKAQPSKYYFELLLQDFVFDGYEKFEKIYYENNLMAIINKFDLKPPSSFIYLLSLRKYEEVQMFAIFMKAFQFIKNTDKIIDPLFNCLLQQPIFTDKLFLSKFDDRHTEV